MARLLAHVDKAAERLLVCHYQLSSSMIVMKGRYWLWIVLKVAQWRPPRRAACAFRSPMQLQLKAADISWAQMHGAHGACCFHNQCM